MNITFNATNITADLANATLNATTNATGIFGGLFAGNVDGPALAIAGAGIAVGAAGLASAIGAGIVGAAGAKTVAEDPKKFSTSLLFQALPQTQGIYGFLIGNPYSPRCRCDRWRQGYLDGSGSWRSWRRTCCRPRCNQRTRPRYRGCCGVGAVGEDKKMFGKSILFSVLPETQALYGFIISILILIGMGLFGAAQGEVTMVMGWAAVGAGLAAGIAALSAIGQGIAAAGGIAAVFERSKVFGKSILFAVLPETQALYGFIISILILIGFGILGVPKVGLSLGVGMFAVAAGLSVGIAALSAIGQGIAASAGNWCCCEE
jgi:V/A-type H+-transporting ATPase subunit K